MIGVAAQGGGWELFPPGWEAWGRGVRGGGGEVGGGGEGGKEGGEAFPFFVPGRYSSSPPPPLLGTKNDQQLFPSEAGSKLSIS